MAEAESVFSQTGGVSIGRGLFSFKATVPFAALAVTDSGLKLSVGGERYLFPRQDIRKLGKHVGLFSSGLKIEHSVSPYASPIIFWTDQFDELKQALEERGFNLSK
jgi:hypothetical protein